ncbi:ubiquitin-specific protease ubp1 [Microbotryomycetes sp. JL221]|nr:ubiquitin-specific protease ubp1 [Microbotryomycetes sp. JL221]
MVELESTEPPSASVIIVALLIITIVSFVIIARYPSPSTATIHPLNLHSARTVVTDMLTPRSASFLNSTSSSSSSSSRLDRNSVDCHEVASRAYQPLLYPGLLNAAGNLCFLNATLQSLASLSSLTTYLEHVPTLDNVLTPVTDSLLSTLDALNTPSIGTQPSPLRPKQLATALAHSSKQRHRLINSSEQQDAHELCTMIREAVEEEVIKVTHLVQTRQQQRNQGLRSIVELNYDDDNDNDYARSTMTRPDSISPMSMSNTTIEQRTTTSRDPWKLLTSQTIKCMSCGYTRDVRHTLDEQIPLQVPPVSHCSLYDLLREYTKIDLLSDYTCQKCSVLATLDKLKAQRDRLALSTSNGFDQVESSSDKQTLITNDNSFQTLPLDASTSTNTLKQSKTMTSSRKDRRRKVQRLLDKLESIVSSSDFEKDLKNDGIKFEKIIGPAGKQIKFARTPNILTIHLSRSVHYGRAGAFKNTCVVSFPEYLDLSPFCDYSTTTTTTTTTSSFDESDTLSRLSQFASPNPNTTKDMFRLTSLIVHYGSHQFGHYVAFRRAPHSLHHHRHRLKQQQIDNNTNKIKTKTSLIQQPEWYRISDETVESATLQQALNANPVLLFYEKINSSTIKTTTTTTTTTKVENFENLEKQQELKGQGSIETNLMTLIQEQQMNQHHDHEEQNCQIVPRVFQRWNIRQKQSVL